MHISRPNLKRVLRFALFMKPYRTLFLGRLCVYFCFLCLDQSFWGQIESYMIETSATLIIYVKSFVLSTKSVILVNIAHCRFQPFVPHFRHQSIPCHSPTVYKFLCHQNPAFSQFLIQDFHKIRKFKRFASTTCNSEWVWISQFRRPRLNLPRMWVSQISISWATAPWEQLGTQKEGHFMLHYLDEVASTIVFFFWKLMGKSF